MNNIRSAKMAMTSQMNALKSMPKVSKMSSGEGSIRRDSIMKSENALNRKVVGKGIGQIKAQPGRQPFQSSPKLGGNGVVRVIK